MRDIVLRVQTKYGDFIQIPAKIPEALAPATSELLVRFAKEFVDEDTSGIIPSMSFAEKGIVYFT